MKKVLASVLSLVMVLTLLPFGAFSVSAAGVEDLTYEIADGEVIITNCNSDASGDLRIPSEIEGYPVTIIGDFAFSDCTGLTSVTIPDSVTIIGECAFYGCTGLTSVTIPDSVASVCPFAFSGCIGLTSIDIPDCVTVIREGSFSGCTGLTSVTIPDSVASIGDGAFNGCTGLTAFVVSQGHPHYCSENGVLFSKDKTALIKYPTGKSGAYTIPVGVTVIGDGAFSDCAGLTSVTIPAGVTAIGNRAFADCTGLTSVSIPSGVTAIGDSAFAWCQNLSTVTIGSGVTAIESGAFAYCYNLGSILIPASVTTIGTHAFWLCEALDQVLYTGTEQDREKIVIDNDGGGNDDLLNAEWYYDCYSVPSIEIPVVNGDFENGDEGWTLGSSASVVADGDNHVLQLDNPLMWSEAALQSVPVKEDTAYRITWKSKRASGTGAFNLIVMDSTDANVPLSGENWMNGSGTDWVEHTVTVTSTYELLKLKFTSEADGSGVILIDDVKVIEIPLVTNGNFETGDTTGWEVWQSTTVSAAAAIGGHYGAHLKGDGSWGGMLNQTFPVKDGKIYELSFWYKVNANGVNFQFQGGQSGTMYVSDWLTQTGWTHFITTVVVSGDTQIKLNFCGGGNGIAEDIYIDEISLIELKEPSFDGYLYNGDFEAGSLNKWDVYQKTAVDIDAAHSGLYGALLAGNGSWGAMLEQTTQPLVAGRTYRLSFWYKTNQSGTNWTLKQNGTTITGCSGWLSQRDWTQVSVTFEAPADGVAVLNFCGGGNGYSENVYLDDVLMEKGVSEDCVFDNPCDPFCNDCGARRETDHVYDGCDDTACNVCGEAREASVHTYANACDPDCDLCGAVREIEGHTYYDSCETTCNKCGEVRETQHTYFYHCDNECMICGEEREGDFHEYDNACDDTCNYCGMTRQVSDHIYDHECDTDCNVCGAVRQVEGHAYDNACDTTCNKCNAERQIQHTYRYPCDATCSVCGATRSDAAPHIYSNYCDSTCDVCGQERQAGDHIYTNACDTTCDECGAVRQADPHRYSNGCDATCNECGATRTVPDHVYDDNWDVDCNECGAIREVQYTTVFSDTVQHSVMDTENGNGLAFRFELFAHGVAAVNGNVADFSNATVNYYASTCKLVGVGVVVTNKSAIGGDDSKMTLENVNGTTVIDIPVVYLCDLEPDSCAFATRVINIPARAISRTIFARPYYIVEVDGEQIVVYGNVDATSCQNVLNSIA